MMVLYFKKAYCLRITNLIDLRKFYFDKFNLNQWDKLGTLVADLYISANSLLSNSIDLNYNLIINQLFIGKTPLTKLSFKGNYKFKTFTSDINIDDNLISTSN